MPDTTPRRGPGRPPRSMPERIDAPPEVIARVVLGSPPPAEWDYQTKEEPESVEPADADGDAV